MSLQSIWIDAPAPELPPLCGLLEVDTVVIGGGITGVLTASRLADAGQSVALLEAGQLGRSNTGGSTGNLYSTVASGLDGLCGKWGDAIVAEMVGLRSAAIDGIEALVERFGIDCGFQRVPLWHCLSNEAEAARASLEAEFDACERVGLAPEWTAPPSPRLPSKRALRLPGQAQFNPYRFTLGVAATLAARGVRVYEQSAVVEIDAGHGRVATLAGEVHARHIVMATHTPLGFNLVQAEMEVYRECGIALRTAAPALPPGIVWLKALDRSLRSHRSGDQHWLVGVGATHRTGEPVTGDPEALLASDLREWFETGPMHVGWSAQQYKSADGLPYIGRSGHEAVLMATGFAADGLVWGAVAASLLGDLITERLDDADNRLSPRRFTPIKSAATWAAENAQVLKHLVADRLGRAEVEALDEVAPGEGRIVDVDGQRLAVYRSPEGALDLLSPVCPHLKCLVAWNAQAHSWDCPRHGSRFRPDGERIEGPALSGLQRVAHGA